MNRIINTLIILIVFLISQSNIYGQNVHRQNLEMNIKKGNELYKNGAWDILNKIWSSKTIKHEKLTLDELNAWKLLWTAKSLTTKGIEFKDFKPSTLYAPDIEISLKTKRSFLAIIIGDNSYLETEKTNDVFINQEFDRVAIETIKYCMENDLSTTPMPIIKSGLVKEPDDY